MGGVIQSYDVILFYVLDDGEKRLQLFAPWSPALGLIGNIYFFYQCKNRIKNGDGWEC
ncbi:MAG: hypothetical protein HC908_12440 [Calothrix sp. SM1_7_51]|nr:hypothetical protein [Calothrix sp. SM1_7_51]